MPKTPNEPLSFLYPGPPALGPLRRTECFLRHSRRRGETTVKRGDCSRGDGVDGWALRLAMYEGELEDVDMHDKKFGFMINDQRVKEGRSESREPQPLSGAGVADCLAV